MKLSVIALALTAPFLHAQDVVTLRSGEKRTGKIAGLDAAALKFQIPLPLSPGSQPVFASVSIPRADIASVEFAPDPALEQLLKSPDPASLDALRSRWADSLPWL